MDNMVLVLDESGAKGYADKTEEFEGDLGVMSGILYTRQEMFEIELMLSQIIKPFKEQVTGKLHIAELKKEHQNALRDLIFSNFRAIKLQWFYKAIYSQGFHQSEFKEKRGGTGNVNASLHVELFRHTFLHSLMMAASLNKLNLNLLVVTDTIDDGILKKFNKEANYLIDVLMGKKRDIFRYIKNEADGKYKKEYASILTSSDSFPKFEKIQFEIKCKDTPLTLAADVLANSVYYYLRKKTKVNTSAYLNNLNSIADHPLSDFAVVQKDEDEVLSILDIMYRRECPK
ncbi:hypothetical protein GW721_04760 [Citrobacter braakii]|nr:hypothetical protein [Citrobacter braakii]